MLITFDPVQIYELLKQEILIVKGGRAHTPFSGINGKGPFFPRLASTAKKGTAVVQTASGVPLKGTEVATAVLIVNAVPTRQSSN